MDSLRGNFGERDAANGADAYHDEADYAAPPVIGADERRMQVRAYNFWAGLLDDRNFPSVDDLDPSLLPDFGPHGVLLDFSTGIDDPAVSFIGAKLAEECQVGETTIRRLSDVPSRSLLSRITDHYMQILANQAPIGFEAEYVNQRGATIMYRGILLPFSSNDETIDFIFGVINWKELADARTTDELLLEIDQALEAPLDHNPLARQPVPPMADWADGPGHDVFPAGAADAVPAPSFDLDGPLDEDVSPASDFAASLADCLAAAREQAHTARHCEDRTRNALYEAIGRAWDFALAAADAPQEFAELVSDAGLTMQDRAPMTPVVKLVFGADYDKTRLTEYAAALTYARRLDLPRGTLADHLAQAPGGLKGIVAHERRLRRSAEGAELPPVRVNALTRLRALPPQDFTSLAGQGEEFALVMVRRTELGEVQMLGEVPADAALVERAARLLVN